MDTSLGGNPEGLWVTAGWAVGELGDVVGPLAWCEVAAGRSADPVDDLGEVIRSLDHDGLRHDLALSLTALAGTLVDVNPMIAVDIAAIIESNAIAPFAAFATSTLAQLVEDLPPETDAARARAATMSYHDALAFLFQTIDTLIAEHNPPAVPS